MKQYILFLCLLLLSTGINSQNLKIQTDKKGKCGYVDLQGNQVVPCKYDVAFPFENGSGKVRKGEKYGMVDASGKEILPVKYDEITVWSGKLYRIKAGKSFGLVSNRGEIVVKPKYSLIGRLNCYGKAIILSGGKEKKGSIEGAKQGLINADGKIVIEPQKYTVLCEFSPVNGRPDKDASNKMSVYDTLKTGCKYVSCFIGKKNIVIDGNGNAVTPLTDKALYSMPSSGLCAFSISNGRKSSSGYYDIGKKKNILLSNNVILPVVCNPFTGSIAKIEEPVKRLSYFVDKSGAKVAGVYIQTKYKDGYWIVYEKDKSCALLYEDGHFIFEKGVFQDLKYPDIKGKEQLLIPAKKNNKWGLVDINGNPVLPFDYDDMDAPLSGNVYAMKGGKKGVVTTSGSIVVPFEYVNVQKCKDEHLTNVWVCKDDKMLYNFDVKEQTVKGDGMVVADNFVEGLAWAVPQTSVLDELQKDGVPSINKGLKKMYNINSSSKTAKSFGVLFDTQGEMKTHIPVTKEMFAEMASAIKDNGGKTLGCQQERRLLLSHTRSVRVYPLTEKIGEMEWDY